MVPSSASVTARCKAARGADIQFGQMVYAQARASAHDRRGDLEAELARLDVEVRRYAEAIAISGPMPAILDALRTREQRRPAITAHWPKCGQHVVTALATSAPASIAGSTTGADCW